MPQTAETSTLSVALSGRMKHGDLLSAMRQRGWNQTQLGEYLGLSPSGAGLLLNLKWVPKRLPDDTIQKLFDLTGKLPEELWPEWTHAEGFTKADKRVDMYRDVTPAMLAGAGAVPRLPPSPDEVFDDCERAKAIDDALKTLSPREEIVVRMRYGLDGDTEHKRAEIAKELGVTTERVRQIEIKATRKLRHPALARGLRPHL